MLGPHIFGGAPVIPRIIAMSSRQSFCCWSVATRLMNAAGLTFVGLVLISAINDEATESTSLCPCGSVLPRFYVLSSEF